MVYTLYEYKHVPALIERMVRPTRFLVHSVISQGCLLTFRFFHFKPKNKVNVISLDESSFEVNNAFITQTEKDHTERHLKDNMTPQSKIPL